MNVVKLAWMLLRGGGRRAMLGSALTYAAVAVSTALLLFAIAGNFAFAERGERSAWRVPSPAQESATLIQAVGQDGADGREITVVYLARLVDDPPVPPGMTQFPEPGQLWVSDALGEAMAELASWRLADRYGEPDGRLGDAAVIHDRDMVAVIGVEPDAPVFDAANPLFETTRTDRFNTDGTSHTYATYRVLMLVATVLMAVPLLVFGGAAARLTVARRDQRLATLRLIGAAPGQVVRLTVAEAVLTAAAGTVSGLALYALAVPLLSLIEIDGAAWRFTDLWPQWWAIAVTVAVVPLLVGLSAVIGLRRVVVSPLGVAKRETPPGMRIIRVVVPLVLVVAFMALAGRFIGMGAVGAVFLLGLLAGVFAAVNFLGPWVVWMLGKIMTAVSRRAPGMLAGRRLTDDPKSAWRTVAGIALTGFTVGFIITLAPPEDGTGTLTLQTTVPAKAVEAVTGDAEENLDVVGTGREEQGSVTHLYFRVIDDAEAVDRFRVAVAESSPGSMVAGSYADNRLMTDVHTGALVVLSVSLLIAMVSSAIAGASSVLDRRRVYGLLHLSGTPMKVLNAARRNETLIPLLVMGCGSVGFGAVLSVPLGAGADVTAGLTALAITLAVGVFGVLAAGEVSRPLLASVMRDLSPRPD